jgi:sec-independent protein translocase protein TatA
MPFSGFELVVVLLIVLIIFGAGKLPQVFGALGKGVREFRDASEGKDDTAATTSTTNTTTTTTGTTAAPTESPVVPPTQPAATQYVPPTADTTQKTG